MSKRPNYRNNYDLTGQVFGVNSVLYMLEERYVSPSGKKHIRWQIKCSLCGTERTATTNNLCQNRMDSCLCQSYTPEICKKRALGAIKGKSGMVEVYGSYRRNAEKRKLSFDISIDQAEKWMAQNCYYCNAIPSSICNKTKHGEDFVYNGIDRKDNQKGYSEENCVPCCKICNRIKHILSEEEFISKIKSIYQHTIKKHNS